MPTPRSLGPSGLDVAPIGLGGMPLSIADRPSESDAVAVIHAALDGGMTLIDTANVYCLDDDDIGHNERLIARALAGWRGDRDGVVVATKGGLTRPEGRWERDARPEALRAACEQSLRDLGVDTIDLYQLHAPDPEVPFAESVGALARLQEEGKIRHVGLSNVSVAQIGEAAEQVEVVSVQNRCNPFDLRAFEEGVIAWCEQNGAAFLPYSPVGGGRGKGQTATHPLLNEVGRRNGWTPFQVALAWLLASSPAMIPIPGASRLKSARDSAAAMDLALSPYSKRKLDAAFFGLGEE